jgi:hypothetical protein
VRAYAVTFLGQCLPVRADLAGDDGTYPYVAERYVQAARPGTRITTTVIYYEYPYADLEVKFDLALRGRPDVIVLEVPARPVAYPDSTPVDLRRLPRRLRSSYQRVRYLRGLNERLRAAPGMDRLVQIADVGLRAVLAGPLRHLVRRYPVPTLAEYETLVAATIARLTAKTTATLILAGPAGFTEAGDGDGYVDGAPDLYDAVNAMVRRIAARHHLPFIDRVAVTAGEGPGFFHPGSSIHYAPAGHRAMGRFLGEMLLSQGIL